MATLYLDAANKVVAFAPNTVAGPPFTPPPSDHTFDFDDASNPVLMAAIQYRPDGLLVSKAGVVTLDGAALRVEADSPDMVARKAALVLAAKLKSGVTLTNVELTNAVRFLFRTVPALRDAVSGALALGPEVQTPPAPKAKKVTRKRS